MTMNSNQTSNSSYISSYKCVSPEKAGEEDFLPSFQMHNSMFNRTLDDPINKKDVLPPQYEESVSETLCSSRQLNSTISTTTEGSYDSSNLLLNNLDKLQRLSLPIEAKITITDDIPTIGKSFQKRNPLKPFYPGETVYGFMTFENKSKLDIPFEMLLVSLECEIGIKHPVKNSIIKKRIITSYDLEASFNFLGLEGDQDICHAYDESDNTFVGFERRNLKPGVSIKKFFKFKLPTYLLDDCCKDQIFEHLKAPPSFGFNAKACDAFYPDIEVEKSLGYGRYPSYGSPIKLNDYAQDGLYCSYFVYAQIIGTNRAEYKPYYTRNITEDYDLIFLRNVEHHILVGKAPLATNEYEFTNGSTKNQVEQFIKLAVETLEVLAEREMLQKAEVTDYRTQDEIIYSTNGKPKQFEISEPEKSLDKLTSEFYLNTANFQFKKDFFNKVEGELIVDAKFEKRASITSCFPKIIEKTKQSNIFDDSSKLYGPVVSVDFTFKPPANAKGSVALPPSITFKPSLIACSVQSSFPIPVSFDLDFIQNNAKTIKEIFTKVALYFNKINNTIKETKLPIPRTTLDSLRGLGSCTYSEKLISDIFQNTTVDLQGKWVYNTELGLYQCSTEVALTLDLEALKKNPKALCASFQTCLFSRLYKIELQMCPKKAKGQQVYLPINVV